MSYCQQSVAREQNKSSKSTQDATVWPRLDCSLRLSLQLHLPSSTHVCAGHADTAAANNTRPGANAAAQLAKASNPAGVVLHHQQQGRAAEQTATAMLVPPGSTSTATFTFRAGLLDHLSKSQQSAAVQPLAEIRQAAPAQHSLLHRGNPSDHRQAQATQGPTFLRGLLADSSVADRGHTARVAQAVAEQPHQPHQSLLSKAPKQASPHGPLQAVAAATTAATPAEAVAAAQAQSAALQAETVATTPGLPTQPPLPQQWLAALPLPHTTQTLPAQAYAAFAAYMKPRIADVPLRTTIGLVFPPNALQDQLDQQFLEHACSRCELVPKAAQRHAALPYSHSSEPPATWRAAVLGCIDWLVEVHQQGILAKDREACKHHAMMFNTLKAATVLSAEQVRLALLKCKVGFTCLCRVFIMQAILSLVCYDAYICTDCTSHN